jgi:hypothetical protein
VNDVVCTKPRGSKENIPFIGALSDLTEIDVTSPSAPIKRTFPSPYGEDNGSEQIFIFSL